MDESWWEAVLAEEEARPQTMLHASPGRESREGTSDSTPVAEPQDLIDWVLARNKFEQDEIIPLVVAGYNRGGLLVNGDQIQGFVPVSHLVDMTAEKDDEEQELFLASYVGQELKLKVIECDPERGRVVLSERAALAESGSRNLLLQRLKSGDSVQGMVTNITDFGIFVDLGGVEGLVHVSEISWGRVRHPSDVVDFGDQVTVHVIGVEPDRSRVALSLKRLSPNPWLSAETRYYPGLVTDAVITSILPFGAFARLEEGLDGLIHISEFDGDAASPFEAIEEGQQVRVRILHVDAARQRLGLSLKLEP